MPRFSALPPRSLSPRPLGFPARAIALCFSLGHLLGENLCGLDIDCSTLTSYR